MRIASSEFADDPCSSVKRGTMVRAARALLSAVTRLLILADMADVMRLLSHLKIVSVIITLFRNQCHEKKKHCTWKQWCSNVFCLIWLSDLTEPCQFFDRFIRYSYKYHTWYEMAPSVVLLMMNSNAIMNLYLRCPWRIGHLFKKRLSCYLIQRATSAFVTLCAH